MRFLLAALTFLVLAAPASASVKHADVTIPASDGVNLVGDVYLPSDGARFPAVVDMEPYGRSSSTEMSAAMISESEVPRSCTPASVSSL